jgi:hypothetical protein
MAFRLVSATLTPLYQKAVAIARVASRIRCKSAAVGSGFVGDVRRRRSHFC